MGPEQGSGTRAGEDRLAQRGVCSRDAAGPLPEPRGPVRLCRPQSAPGSAVRPGLPWELGVLGDRSPEVCARTPAGSGDLTLAPLPAVDLRPLASKWGDTGPTCFTRLRCGVKHSVWQMKTFPGASDCPRHFVEKLWLSLLFRAMHITGNGGVKEFRLPHLNQCPLCN